jgi:hypothetical protein
MLELMQGVKRGRVGRREGVCIGGCAGFVGGYIGGKEGTTTTWQPPLRSCASLGSALKAEFDKLRKVCGYGWWWGGYLRVNEVVEREGVFVDMCVIARKEGRQGDVVNILCVVAALQVGGEQSVCCAGRWHI